MLWLALATSSTMLGFAVVEVVRCESFTFIVHLSLGWLLGSLLTAVAFFVINFLLPINFFTASILCVLEFYICYIYVQKWRPKRKTKSKGDLRIVFELTWKFYFSVAITALIASFHLFFSYSNFPYEIPKIAKGLIDSEMSFISSVLKGVNRRRSHIAFYKNPRVANEYFTEPVLPLLFTTGLCAMGAGYGAASMFIGWMNSVATAAILYYSLAHYTKYTLTAVICFLFNSGWAFLRYTFGDCKDGDLVHDICFKVPVPWYPTFGYFLCFSKAAGYTIPLSIMILLLIQMVRPTDSTPNYILACVLFVLIPSPTTSIVIYLAAGCFPTSFSKFWPCGVILPFNFFLLKPRLFPVWREYQMAGVFFGVVMFLIDAFGPLVLAIPLSLLSSGTVHHVHRLCVFFSLIILPALFRLGNGSDDSILAITAVVLPFLCCAFGDLLFDIYESLSSPAVQGITRGILIVVVFSIVFGGFVNMARMKTVYVATDEDIECGKWIEKNVPRHALVISNSRTFSPVTAFAGRQILCGDLRSLWWSGAKLTKSLQLLREIERAQSPTDVMNRIGSKFVVVQTKMPFCNTSNLTRLYSSKSWEVYTI